MVEVVMNGDPMSWATLAAAVGENADSPALRVASRKRAFTDRVIVAAPSGKITDFHPEALVFRADRLAVVAASGRLLRLALRYARATSTHLHTPAELQATFRSAALKAAFGRALETALAKRSLPTGVHAVLRRGHFYLLAAEDLVAPIPSNAGSPARARTGENPAALSRRRESTHRVARNESFAEVFDRAFRRIDTQTGRRNFVKLLSLRKALPQFSRADFDRELNALRRAGLYSLDAAEGTHDRTTPEEREAGVIEAGRRLLYCARR